MPGMLGIVTIYDAFGKARSSALSMINEIANHPADRDLTRNELMMAKIAVVRAFPSDPVMKAVYIYFGREGVICI